MFLASDNHINTGRQQESQGGKNNERDKNNQGQETI